MSDPTPTFQIILRYTGKTRWGKYQRDWLFDNADDATPENIQKVKQMLLEDHKKHHPEDFE